MSLLTFVTRSLLSALALCFALLLVSVTAQAVTVQTVTAQTQSQPNGLVLDHADPAALQGVVAVFGVAHHPTFRKWQLDFLWENGETVFLSLGEKPVSTADLLVSLDTRLYPDGAYRLRLRVVHSNLNYDEYFLPIQIVNQAARRSAQAGLLQAPVATSPSVVTSAPTPTVGGNGLSLSNQGRFFSVRGVADHPSFRKWQVDLLIDGNRDQSIFLAVGAKPVPAAAELVTLDAADYPPGAHQLRLRVVHSNLNYDEYLTPLFIGSGSPSGGYPPAPSVDRRGSLLVRGQVNEAAIYLTFDDGPHPRHTAQILDVLAEYDAKATFFVVGSQAQGRGELLKKMYDAGHALANHSWSHRKLGSVDWETFETEVDATAQVLGAYGSHCLRPPYGDIGPNLYANAAKAGYSLVYWSVDSLDWKSQNAESIANEVLTYARPGAIILMHDGGGNRAGTVAALRTILATLTQEGYSFPTLCR